KPGYRVESGPQLDLAQSELIRFVFTLTRFSLILEEKRNNVATHEDEHERRTFPLVSQTLLLDDTISAAT
ncbi:unnamed protein product, partial [Sphenostylis stenocarpa]